MAVSRNVVQNKEEFEKWNSLPPELKNYVLDFFSGSVTGLRVLAQFSCTSKESYRLANQNYLWEPLFKCHFPCEVDLITSAEPQFAREFKKYYLLKIKVKRTPDFKIVPRSVREQRILYFCKEGNLEGIKKEMAEVKEKGLHRTNAFLDIADADNFVKSTPH